MAERKVAITFSASMFSGAVTDFPGLIARASLPDEMCSPTGTNAAQADGGDIRAYSDEALTTQLPLEVVHFGHDSVEGAGDAKVELWVKIPSGDNSVGATVWLRYNSDSTESQPAVTDAYGRNAVWSDYEAVYHGGSLTDATGGGNDLTANGGPTVGSGTSPWGGNAYALAAASSQYLDTATAPVTAEPFTMQCWFRANSVNALQGILDLADSSTAANQWLLSPSILTANRLEFGTRNGATFTAATFGSNLSTSTWYHAAAVAAANNDRNVYQNGVAGAADPNTRTPSSVDRFSVGRLGDSTPSNHFTGDVAEIRIRAQALSGDWLTAEYRNGSDPGTYVTAGTPEDAAGGGATVTLTASLDAAVQRQNVLAQATMDAALQKARTATATLDAALQAAMSATAQLDAAVQAERATSAELDAAVQAALSAAVVLDAALRAERSGTASLDAAVRAERSGTASLDAAVQAARTLAASLDAALRATRTVTATLDAFLTGAASTVLTASLDAALQKAVMLFATLDAAIQRSGLTASATLDAALSTARSVAILLDVAVARTVTADADLDAALSANRTLSAMLDARIGAFTPSPKRTTVARSYGGAIVPRRGGKTTTVH